MFAKVSTCCNEQIVIAPLPTAPTFVLVQYAHLVDKHFKGEACVWPVESIAASESEGPQRTYPWHRPCGQLCKAGNGRLDAHSPRPFLAIDVCRGDSGWTHQVNRWGKGKAREGPEQVTVPGKLQLTGGGGMTKSHKGQGHGGE